MDRVDVRTRSRMMAAVGSKNTTPELVVRRAIHAHGLRYRLHARELPGAPDLVLTRHRTAIFVHGCFWHRHTCPKGRLPASNTHFWGKKLAGNLARDARVETALVQMGWRVIVLWECEIRGIRWLDRVLSGLAPDAV